VNKKQKEAKLWFLLINNYFVVFAWGLFAPLFALVVLEKGGDAQTVGFTWGIYTLISGLLMIIFGKLEDHDGRFKLSLLLGNVVLIGASAYYLFVETIPQIIIAQIIFAIGFGLYMPALKALFSRLSIRGKEASEWAMMDGGNMLIMSLASILGGVIVKMYGIGPLFMVMVGIQTIGTFILLRGLQKARKH
jgi:MFS family permease